MASWLNMGVCLITGYRLLCQEKRGDQHSSWEATYGSQWTSAQNIVFLISTFWILSFHFLKILMCTLYYYYYYSNPFTHFAVKPIFYCLLWDLIVLPLKILSSNSMLLKFSAYMVVKLVILTESHGFPNVKLLS